MDGTPFALRISASILSGQADFDIGVGVPASVSAHLQPGQAVQIFTGAAVP